MFCTPSLFSTKEFNRQFIFVCERHVYQQTVTLKNNEVTLMTLHCVSCRVRLFHLLGSSYGILENICTRFTHYITEMILLQCTLCTLFIY